jgi:exosortase A-associated hydrolase 2
MEAFFLPASGGQRFCIYHAASGKPLRGSVLYIHPFAEEMNKSRRMAALQARAFSGAGYAVLQIDLMGCGDSSGDFADATWEAWLQDVTLACEWLRRRSPSPLWLWGLRSGCLLAIEAVSRMNTAFPLLFWQPSSNGALVLRQFLRLKSAAEMLSGSAGGAIDSLRRDLAEGKRVEVAGYELAPDLASGLERATLAPPRTRTRIEWLDVSIQKVTQVPPVVAGAKHKWEQAGCSVRYTPVQGPPFWQTTEIEEAPNLIDATLTTMLEPIAA